MFIVHNHPLDSIYLYHTGIHFPDLLCLLVYPNIGYRLIHVVSCGLLNVVVVVAFFLLQSPILIIEN